MEKYTVEKYSDDFTPKRWDIINYLIDKHKFVNYLEIGVYDGLCINQIHALHKDGVDPGVELDPKYFPEINYPISSDEFFYLIKDCSVKYDIIFIDGLHHSNQVDKDIINSFNHISENGFVILHDCNPPEYNIQVLPRQEGIWNGDVWKSVVKLRCTNPNISINVIDTDWGIGILSLGNNELYTKDSLNVCLDYFYFDSHREELLNIISVEEFYKKYETM
jgi:hypothetical protein